MDLRFPVEEQFLPQLSVKPAVFHDWRERAHLKVMQILQTRDSFYYEIGKEKVKHKLTTEKYNFRGYSKKASNTSPGKYDYICESSVDGSLEDIAYGTYCETTFDQRVVFAHLYDEQFLDGAVLQVFENASPQDPFQFVGMKWLAIAPPAGGFLRPRDYIYFEYSGTASDLRGRRVLFRMMRSVQLDSSELRENDFGFSRGSLYDLHIYTLDRDCVRVLSYGCYDSVGMSSMLVMRALNSYWNNVVNLPRLADVRAIVNSGLMKTIMPAKEGKTKSCHVCNKAFSLLRIKQACRGCGEFCCRHCTVRLRSFNEQAIYSASTLPVVTEKFCLQCVLRARGQRGIEQSKKMRESQTPTSSLSVPTLPPYKIPTSLKRCASESPNTFMTSSDGQGGDRQFKIQTPSVTSEESNSSDMILLDSCWISEDRHRPVAAPAPVVPDPFEQMNRSLAAQEDLLNHLKRGMTHQQPYEFIPLSRSPVMANSPPQPRNDEHDISDRFEVLS